MQSLSKKPLSNKSNNTYNTNSSVNETGVFQQAKATDDHQKAPGQQHQPDQWSTNRLQQIIKSDHQVSQQTRAAKSNENQFSATSNNSNTAHKRERNGNSESSSSKSVKAYNEGSRVKTGPSKESSEEPVIQQQNGPLGHKTQVRQQQQQRSNQNQNQAYSSQYTSSKQHQQKSNNQRHVAEIYDDEDDYVDDYSDEDTKPNDNRNAYNPNGVDQSYASRNGNFVKSNQVTGSGRNAVGHQSTNKRSVNIVSPASNFRRGGNANNTRTGNKFNANGNDEFTNEKRSNNNNYQSSNRQFNNNNNNNNNYCENYGYENTNSESSQIKQTRNNRRDNGGYYNEPTVQSNNNNSVKATRNTQKQHQQPSHNQTAVANQEKVANTSATNSVHSDNKSTRSNRLSTGKNSYFCDK